MIHKIDRIVIACRDPRGDITSIKPELIGDYYYRNWPSLEYGLFFEESFNLLMNFYSKRNDPESRGVVHLFAKMMETETRME